MKENSFYSDLIERPLLCHEFVRTKLPIQVQDLRELVIQYMEQPVQIT